MNESNKEEFIRIISLAAINYPNFQLDEPRLKLFYTMLKDIDIKTLEASMLLHIGSSSFPPTVADLRKKAVEIEEFETSSLDATKAWGEVMYALRAYGYYDAKNAFKSMSPLTSKVIRSMGWTELCKSDKLAVERGQFIKLYNSYKDRIMKEKQIPKFVSSKILKIQEENELKRMLDAKNAPLIDEHTTESLYENIHAQNSIKTIHDILDNIKNKPV